MRVQTAIEDMVSNLGRLIHRIGPVWGNRDSMEIERTAGGIVQYNLASEYLRGQLFRFSPSGHLLGPIDFPVASERELTARSAFALIDHSAYGMPVLPMVHTVKDNLGDRLLTTGALAARLIIEDF